MISTVMKTSILFALFIFIHGIFPSVTYATERAMVFSGKNINTALFLGMFDAATDAGKPADLVIGSCGGAIGAALVNIESNRERRLEFLKSRSYFEILKNVGRTDSSLLYFLKNVMRLERKAAKLNAGKSPHRWLLTDWFQFSLIDRGTAFANIPEFSVPFSSSGVQTIIIAARTTIMAPTRNTVVSSETKLFKEVYFTSPELAETLDGSPSFTGREFPESAVEAVVETRTPKAVIEAVMSSGSDPIYLGPTLLDGHYFFTGAIDLHAVDLAKKLANEVIASYPSVYEPSFENPLVQATFGFDPNEYNRRVIAYGADYWIDFSDAIFVNFSPRGFWNLREAVVTASPTRAYVIRSGVAQDYAAYIADVQKQYRHGYERTLESLRGTRGALQHIRKPIQ